MAPCYRLLSMMSRLHSTLRWPRVYIPVLSGTAPVSPDVGTFAPVTKRRLLFAALALLVIVAGVLLACFSPGGPVTVVGKATPEDVRAIRGAISRCHWRHAREMLKCGRFGAALESVVQISAPRIRQIAVVDGQTTTNGAVARVATVLTRRSLYSGLIYRYSLAHTSSGWGQVRFTGNTVPPAD